MLEYVVFFDKVSLTPVPVIAAVKPFCYVIWAPAFVLGLGAISIDMSNCNWIVAALGFWDWAFGFAKELGLICIRDYYFIERPVRVGIPSTIGKLKCTVEQILKIRRHHHLLTLIIGKYC